MHEPLATSEPQHEDAPRATPLVVAAFLLPSLVMSAFLADPWRLTAIALLCVLALLLTAAATWSARAARAQGRGAMDWAFLTIVTLGLAMLVLVVTRHETGGRTFVCMECGSAGAADDAFCYRCGAA